MWGLSGASTIGLRLELASDQLLRHVRLATQSLVLVLKYTHSLQLWFRGQLALGDFLA